MMTKYSLVFEPDQRVLHLVEAMKDTLFNQIGAYSGRNSTTYITIFEFETMATALPNIVQQIEAAVLTCKAQHIYFDRLGDLPKNGAFFIKPADYARTYLKTIMWQLNAAVPYAKTHTQDNPQINVACKLGPEELKITHNLFPFIDLDFFCDKILLRVFDEEQKHFVALQYFKFGNQKKLEGQLSLF